MKKEKHTPIDDYDEPSDTRVREGRVRTIATAVFGAVVAVGLTVLFLINTKDARKATNEHYDAPITSHSSPISDFDTEYGGEIEEEENGFRVSSRKYRHSAGNIMVLNVENKTDKAYTVTVTGHYLDENGEELELTRLTFKGMAPGYTHQFIFDPGFVFADFKYELTNRFFEGTPYAASLSFEGKEECVLAEKDGLAAVSLRLPEITNGNTKALDLEMRLIVFDGNGNIIINEDRSLKNLQPGDHKGDTVVLNLTDIPWDESEKYEIPAEFSDLTYIYAVTSAEKAK